MKAEFLARLNEARAARRACVLVTQIGGEAQRLVFAEGMAGDPLGEALEAALRSGKSQRLAHEGADYFLTVQAPPVRLLIIGAVHVSQALAPMATLAGLDVTIIDPRTAFATPERFPDVRLLAQWPDEALRGLALERYSAMACLTHDLKIDDPALEAALRADCFYIGALGSRKTHGKRVERLTAKGFSEADIARIHAPIGLDIGAVAPAEIAVSILGEIIASMRKKPLRAESAA